MSVNRRKRRLQSTQPAVSENPPHRYGWLYPFTLGSIVAGVIVFATARNFSTEVSVGALNPPTTRVAGTEHPTLGELAEMSADELRGQDIALLNLRCAEGLPGAEKLDIPKCLATLDKWAASVKHETDRHLYKFRQNPNDYENSEAYFRMLCLITVLQQDFKIHYNAERIRDVDFTKSQDLFIHGMIGNDNGGTCVSMPVLYTAIARRLDYPVFLVSAKAHLFCRWQDAKEHVNVEGSSRGMLNYDDAYYMNWPKPISETEVKAGHYLKSLVPGEELAVFLSARGHCLEDTGRLPEALVSYAQALQRKPDSPDYFSFLANSMGFRQTPNFQHSLHRQPVQPPIVYPAAHDPFASTGMNRNPGMGWAQPSPSSNQYDVFKPVVPSPYGHSAGSGYEQGFGF